MTSTQRGVIVSDDESGSRLDKYLAELFSEQSRSVWERRIADGQVLVDGLERQPSYRIKSGDPVTIIETDKEPDKINLPIVYEDEDVIVINKPSGLLTHSKGGLSNEATVASTLRDKVSDDGSNRPGIVHRLDRDTSGLLIVAKTTKSREYLQKQFANRTVKKTYHAVTLGTPKDGEGIIKYPIERNPKKPSTFRVGAQGKPSETHYKVLATSSGKSLIELRPKTGRTHQIRVHLKAIDCPILGDKIYGRSDRRLYLHASDLEIAIEHNQHKKFHTELPKEFSDVMAK